MTENIPLTSGILTLGDGNPSRRIRKGQSGEQVAEKAGKKLQEGLRKALKQLAENPWSRPPSHPASPDRHGSCSPRRAAGASY
jgi:hypothetical protein